MSLSPYLVCRLVIVTSVTEVYFGDMYKHAYLISAKLIAMLHRNTERNATMMVNFS